MMDGLDSGGEMYILLGGAWQHRCSTSLVYFARWRTHQINIRNHVAGI